MASNTSKKFEKQAKEINVSLKELDDDDDVKTWRLQLDVKTTRNKAKEIEKFLRQNLEKMI